MPVGGHFTTFMIRVQPVYLSQAKTVGGGGSICHIDLGRSNIRDNGIQCIKRYDRPIRIGAMNWKIYP